jgi:uncharacterized protein with HEPN domain
MIEERTAVDLDRMCRAAQTACAYVRGMAKEAFVADTKTQDAVALQLVVIGAAAARIAASDPDFTARYPSWPWTEIRGMRNRIAHDYHRLDQDVIWETVQTALPGLFEAIESVGPLEGNS